MTRDKFKPDQDSLDRWAAVDRYFSEQLSLSDPALDAAMAANKSAELPAIDVAPNQGKLLQLLAQLVGARRILEIGTLGGYSTIWLASALPAGGRLITLEFSPKHAEIARANIARAGLSDLIEIRIGAALDTLPKLQTEIAEPFDLIFIDADKTDKDVQGARHLFELLANEPRLSSTAIQTVGVKGYDGFAFALVTAK